jgi:hypothetical protein
MPQAAADLKGLTHVTHKRVVSKWLLEKTQCLSVETVMSNGVIGVTRHVENSDLRVTSGDLAGKFPACHSGHDHVC